MLRKLVTNVVIAASKEPMSEDLFDATANLIEYAFDAYKKLDWICLFINEGDCFMLDEDEDKLYRLFKGWV